MGQFVRIIFPFPSLLFLSLIRKKSGGGTMRNRILHTGCETKKMHLLKTVLTFENAGFPFKGTTYPQYSFHFLCQEKNFFLFFYFEFLYLFSWESPCGRNGSIVPFFFATACPDSIFYTTLFPFLLFPPPRKRGRLMTVGMQGNRTVEEGSWEGLFSS